jgi:serine/threonine protein kinase
MAPRAQLFDAVVETDGLLRAGMTARALRWLSHLADAISHAHDHGMAHGQIQPEHLLLREDAVALLGFHPPSWIELKRGPSQGGQIALRPSGEGSRDAPELRGRTHASLAELAAADVWAVGVLFVSMLDGAPPRTELCHSEMFVALPPDVERAPTAVVDLCNSMLRLSATDRPNSATLVAAAKALLMPPPLAMAIGDTPATHAPAASYRENGMPSDSKRAKSERDRDRSPCSVLTPTVSAMPHSFCAY